jgi:hypothetical protein
MEDGVAGIDQATTREVIADHRRALELNNRDAVAHLDVAWLEHLLGNDAVAGGEWREAVAIASRPPGFR